jgi:phenylacetate-CoA ligase
MDERFWDARMESLPEQRRQLLHEHRLHWQVRRCWDASPFYRARLERAGLDPATFRGLVDWPRFGVVRPEDLADATSAGGSPTDLIVAPRAWWHDLDRTGSGPARALTDGDLVHRADLAARALWAAGGRPGRRLALIGDRADSRTAGAIVAGAERIGMADAGGDPTRRECSAESFVVAVATDWAAPPPVSDPRLIWAPTFDPASVNVASPARALLHPVVGPTLAYACAERQGLHWCDDHLLVEVVDPTTRQPLPAGATGAVIVTDLIREGSPLLRFWTGLAAALIEGPCACGRTSARSLAGCPLG